MLFLTSRWCCLFACMRLLSIITWNKFSPTSSKKRSPYASGDPVGPLLWTAHHGLCGCDVQAEGPPATDDFPGPNEDPGWVGPADALCCQGGWRKPKGSPVFEYIAASRIIEDILILIFISRFIACRFSYTRKRLVFWFITNNPTTNIS